ncbi:MAG: hypothetical protein KAW49_10550, partial [Anaerolineae bacterium]|nr:hypothetical protein [Anaerolineae bacterium]
MTKGTEATIGPGATTAGAEGRFNQLELIKALGTEYAPSLSTAYAARREQQIQETSFDFLHQIYSGQVT